MYGIGSTITATQWPRFYHEDKCHILPRPYQSCKPFEPGWVLMQKPWFIDLVQLMEKKIIKFLETCTKTPYVSQVISDLDEVKNIVPNCLRLSETFFTQVSIVTSNGEKDMEIHVDEGDIINAVFHLGKLRSGGSTSYFEMDEKTGMIKEKQTIPFQHGRVQIGFYSKIYHCAKSFDGIRFTLNFNVKKFFFKHFRSYGRKYYDQLIDRNYNGELLIAR